MGWGHVGLFWGDAGRWLHEVERFAGGEVLYRDYGWPFPPFALWLLGSIATVAGAELAVIWTATSLVFLLVMLLYVH